MEWIGFDLNLSKLMALLLEACEKLWISEKMSKFLLFSSTVGATSAYINAILYCLHCIVDIWSQEWSRNYSVTYTKAWRTQWRNN